MDQTIDPNRIIDAFGGTCATASKCGVTPSAVSQWRDNGIPRPWMKYLRADNPEVFRALESAGTKASS